jgi:hypothetical protein
MRVAWGCPIALAAPATQFALGRLEIVTKDGHLTPDGQTVRRIN